MIGFMTASIQHPRLNQNPTLATMGLALVGGLVKVGITGDFLAARVVNIFVLTRGFVDILTT